MTIYRNVTREGDTVEGEESFDGGERWIRFSANWSLFRIREALWSSQPGEPEGHAYRRIWALQDGYGEPGTTPVQGYDWSGIRDSSPEAIAAMNAVAAEYVTDEDINRMLGLS